ncbi:MAG: DNA polymerase III subunit gamma/tau [Sphingomonadales bacterium]|nr:DNA polymerase III subunit gamma/tau [Sphingomonadales bacterium]MBU3992765.1 DNA polymerase III subunit gamma/tau [Alphaproteobacteria bacterium]
MDDSSDIFGEGPGPEGPGNDGVDHAGEEPRVSAAELEAAGQSALFGAAEPAPAAAPVADPAPAAPVQPYRVLARKYRPQTFSELIGQDAMVQTLANAIRRDRLAHAFLMTGVRGVGKTSTARLIAKALNCIGPDGQGGPTIDPCGRCEPCVAIAEGRHIDVIEMDAASHTGVDDVREIIEAVRYSAVSARFKIYIIDEVHMLSRNAFNALLKTLEEPPAHVKFLFATTEVDKLPVTVLSRCQRFDLRRVTAPLLAGHFAMICAAEGVPADDEALAMIAAAAEGSVRDGLSILDQAIAHADMVGSSGDSGEGRVTPEQVQEMLGLADKTVQRRLLAALLAGDASGVLELVETQFALGVEPLALMRSQMELVHRITVAQIGRTGAEAISAEERAAIDEWAGALSAGQLHRLWQLLLKGHDEVRTAPDPLVTAQMALLRVLHAADLPDPGQLVRKLEHLAANPAALAPPLPGAAPAASAAISHEGMAQEWAALVRQVEHSAPLAGSTMRLGVRVIELQPGLLRYELAPGLPDDPTADIRKALERATDRVWQVERGEGRALPSLEETHQAAEREAQAAVRRAPLVEAAFAAFPDARIVDEDSAPPGSGGSDRGWSRSA